MVDDAEDFDFETDGKIVEGIFLKLNTRKAIGLYKNLWKTSEIARFPAFCCIQSVVYMVSERKHCTLYLENLCSLSCSKK